MLSVCWCKLKWVSMAAELQAEKYSPQMDSLLH